MSLHSNICHVTCRHLNDFAVSFCVWLCFPPFVELTHTHTHIHTYCSVQSDVCLMINSASLWFLNLRRVTRDKQTKHSKGHSNDYKIIPSFSVCTLFVCMSMFMRITQAASTSGYFHLDAIYTTL